MESLTHNLAMAPTGLSNFYLNEPDAYCLHENDLFPDELYCMPQLQEHILTCTSLGLTLAVILAALYIGIVSLILGLGYL